MLWVDISWQLEIEMERWLDSGQPGKETFNKVGTGWVFLKEIYFYRQRIIIEETLSRKWDP